MWETSKINTICQILGGKPAPKDNGGAFDVNGIPFVRMKDLGRFHLTTNLIETANCISFEYASKNNIKPIPKGAILLPRSGSVGLNHRAILGQDSIIVSHICALIVKDENKINNRFLYYWLTKYDMNQVAKKTTGLDAINFHDLGNIEVSYPDLETQNKIVAILDKANTIFEKREKTIQKYDELLKAIFLEMFGDPVLNTKKWQLWPFSKIVKNENSKRIPIKKSDRDKREGSYPYYGATGIIDHIDEYKFDGNYLLIAEDGKNLLLNRKNNAFLASGKFWVNNHAHVLSDNGTCSIYYLLYFLNLIDLKPYITGIDQIKLNKSNLEQISVPIPPKELQTNFNSTFLKYEKLKVKTIKSRDLIARLKNCLSQLAFKGELDFNTAVDLEVLLENDYQFFKENSNTKSIRLLLERLNTDNFNKNNFYEPGTYNKAKSFVFELLREGKVKQIFDENSKRVKLTVK